MKKSNACTQLSHTGGTDDHHTLFQPDQLSVGGGMAAFTVVLPDAAQ